jgi:tripartite ATP-independent transporter DctP family solute receptor
VRKNVWVLLISVLALSLALTGCGGSKDTKTAADAPIKLIAAHNQTSPDNPYQVGLLKFKEVVEKKSNGKMTVEVHAGTLGTNENELVEKIKLKAIDVAVVSPGFMTQTGVKEVDLLALPYLFDSYDHWKKVIDGEVGTKLAGMINQKSNNDFKIIGYWSAGVRHYYGKKPLNSMADLKDMKIRTQTSGVIADYWKSLGAIPTSVAWGELYQALQQKTVDGSENSYPYFVQQNHHKTENGKYTTEIGADFTTRFLLVNGKKFDGLTKEQQQILLEAAKASVEAERESVTAQEKEYKEKAIKEGAAVNTIDRKPFIEKALPIQDKFAASINAQEILKQIRATK